MNIHKRIIAIIFISIIYCPIIFDFINFATNKKLDVSLNGFFETIESPELSMNSYIQGEYQINYEKWLNTNFIPRGLFTKLYNQIEFSCFDLGNRIIGKNNNIFEYDYIADALCLDESNYATPPKSAELEEYVEHLVSIQHKLQQHNKYLVLYTTPSKAVHQFEDIPMQYTIRQSDTTLRAADYLKELLNNTNIPYLDSETLMVSHEYPLFYSTGIHWARPIEQETSQALITLLNEISNKNLRNIFLTSMNTSSTPYGRDSDVYDLLNIYSPYPAITYYEYSSQREYPMTYDKARILLQGGSFAQGLYFDYPQLYSNAEISYINYDNYIIDELGNTQILETWNDLNLSTYLDKVDFIIIELQEAHINIYSSGFVAYLDNYLDTYIPTVNSSSNKIYDSNLDTALQTGLSTSKGLWQYENNLIWAKESSYFTLKNENITANGITFELTVPEYSLTQGNTTIRIYINQKMLDTITISEPGEIKLDYDSNLFSSKTNIYEIEIYCDNSFIPSEIGLSEDSRELSLMIHYIGEKR